MEFFTQLCLDKNGKCINHFKVAVKFDGADLNDLVDKPLFLFTVGVVPFKIYNNIIHVNKTPA